MRAKKRDDLMKKMGKELETGMKFERKANGRLVF